MKTSAIRTRKKAFANRIYSVHGFGCTARRIKKQKSSGALWNKWRDQTAELNASSASLSGATIPELVVKWWEN
ncbi:MAG: hypothetical protein ACXVP0_11090 [Bacteroidia bacterium]